MKKLISCLIMLSVFFSTVPIVSATENYNNAEVFAKGIGLIKEEKYIKDKVITRAEFAGLLADLLRLNDLNADEKEWQENNFSVNSNETALIDASARRFKDVDVSHPYYSQIIAVCQKGYMRGVSEKNFAPEYNLVMGDAVRVFINMLGYAEMANMNYGIANSIGLVDGISTAMDKPATEGDIIKLIHNALDINVLEIKFNGTDLIYETSDETFMSAVLKMDKVKGIMTDNGHTSFKEESIIGESQVQVGGIIANISEDTEYVRDFIGHKVELYYYIDGDEYEVQYAEIARDDNSFSFNIADFENFDGKSISYFNGKRSVNEKLADTVNMIYNGEAKTIFNETVFDFESGEVTLVDTMGNGYDLIIVTCYEFAVISSKNVNEEVIYNKIKNPLKPDLNKIDYSIDGTYERVTIKDTAGNNLSVADLRENDVLNILRNSKEMEITVSKISVDGFKVQGIEKDDFGRTIIADSENKYMITDEYEHSTEKTDFMVGSTYTVYLNQFNMVVWAEKYAGGESIGILTRVRYSEEEAEPFREVRIFTSGGKLEKITAAEKIRINDVNKKFEKAVTELEDYYGKAIMYTLNADGVLTNITTAEPFGALGDRGWYEIGSERTYKYAQNDKDLSQLMYYVEGITMLFTVPTDPAEYGNEKAFSVNTHAFSDGQSVTATGYAKDKYSVIPDCLVIKKETVGVGAVSVLSDIFVIDKISTGLNSEDEVVKVMTGWEIDISEKKLSYTQQPVSDECIMVDQKNGYEIDPNGNVELTGPRTFSELSKGDIIRYDKDANGNIFKIRIAYDCSTGSYFNTGAGGFGSDVPLYSDSYAGSTAGSTWAGYLLTKSGIGVRITKGTNILPGSVDLMDVEGLENSLRAFKIDRPNAILVVEKNDGGTIKMYRGSLEDLTTYQESGSNAGTDILVMLTHWTSATRGTVIYKNFDLTK